jgi:hypothetical protein
MAGKERYGLGFNLLLIQSLPDVAPGQERDHDSRRDNTASPLLPVGTPPSGRRIIVRRLICVLGCAHASTPMSPSR